jgi:hypothetical protein
MKEKTSGEQASDSQLVARSRSEEAAESRAHLLLDNLPHPDSDGDGVQMRMMETDGVFDAPVAASAARRCS